MPYIDMIQYRQDISRAVEIGVERALGKLGLVKTMLSKQDAYRMYGRSNVERWIKERLIHPVKDGDKSAKWRIDRSEIEIVAMTSNRHTYLTTEERPI